MLFEKLLDNISQVHNSLQQSAIKAINQHITLRNWVIGCYIVEYEQKGEDRAKYGDNLTERLAQLLNIKGLGSRNLRSCRLFYLTYTQFSTVLQSIALTELPIWQTLSAKLVVPTNSIIIPPKKLIESLSFSHFILLLQIQDPIKRAFYELECIKGVWDIKTLKRQISTLYFERSGLSKDPKRLSEIIQANIEPTNSIDIIKSPYTFEFLGLQAKDVVYEDDIEQALIEHLQEFILELGDGFCFEARQKSILIGDEYFFIDLVFYHRILKCHILLELKIDDFKHNYVGQLNTYVNYYKAEVMRPDDNPPIGILLVTDKNKTLVEYALAGMDNQLFVSKYLVQLPNKDQLLRFIEQELKQF
jgi:predicted nuclease of restriction endonuclease-like (RecB) superfamily